MVHMAKSQGKSSKHRTHQEKIDEKIINYLFIVYC